MPPKNGLPNSPDKHFVWRQHIDARRRRKPATLRPCGLRIFAQFGKLVVLGFLGFRTDYYTLLRLLLSVQGNTAADDGPPNAYQIGRASCRESTSISVLNEAWQEIMATRS